MPFADLGSANPWYTSHLETSYPSVFIHCKAVLIEYISYAVVAFSSGFVP